MCDETNLFNNLNLSKYFNYKNNTAFINAQFNNTIILPVLLNFMFQKRFLLTNIFNAMLVIRVINSKMDEKSYIIAWITKHFLSL